MQLHTRVLSACAITTALAAPLLFAAGPAAASGGHRAVTNAGTCSQHGRFELAAKHDDGALEIEFEVDTNVVGQSFFVRLTDNGSVVLRRTVVTSAPSGSFTVAKRTFNRMGADVVRARAVSGSNACGGRVAL